MFNKNKVVRNLIYILFCLLILIVGTALTYYIGFYDENIVDQKEMLNNPTEAGLDDINCDEDDGGFVFGSLFYKFSTAFLAGSLLSDKVFLKLGVI